MNTLAGAHELAALGAALQYPREGIRESLQALRGRLHKRSGAAAGAIKAFLDATADSGESALAETYTRTFDLAPQCAPYLGTHLFGEQDARRNQLMVGLAQEYAGCGFQPEGELPDHVAVVMQALHHLPEQPQREVASLCLVPALASMLKQLESTGNPFGHLIRAASLLLCAEPSASTAMEASHA